MNDLDDEISKALTGLEEPEPPSGLRDLALARARAAWGRPAVIDRWRRAWESRPLRLAWAAAVLLLAAANVAVRASAVPGSRSRGTSAASTVRSPGGGLRAVVALPRLRAEYASGAATAQQETTRGTPGPAHRRHESEDKS